MAEKIPGSLENQEPDSASSTNDQSNQGSENSTNQDPSLAEAGFDENGLPIDMKKLAEGDKLLNDNFGEGGELFGDELVGENIAESGFQEGNLTGEPILGDSLGAENNLYGSDNGIAGEAPMLKIGDFNPADLPGFQSMEQLGAGELGAQSQPVFDPGAGFSDYGEHRGDVPGGYQPTNSQGASLGLTNFKFDSSANYDPISFDSKGLVGFDGGSMIGLNNFGPAPDAFAAPAGINDFTPQGFPPLDVVFPETQAEFVAGHPGNYSPEIYEDFRPAPVALSDGKFMDFGTDQIAVDVIGNFNGGANVAGLNGLGPASPVFQGPIGFDGAPAAVHEFSPQGHSGFLPVDFDVSNFENFVPADFNDLATQGPISYDGGQIGFNDFDPQAYGEISPPDFSAADFSSEQFNDFGAQGHDGFGPDLVDVAAAKHFGITPEQAAVIGRAIGNVGPGGLSAEQAAKAAEFIGDFGGSATETELNDFAANAAQFGPEFGSDILNDFGPVPPGFGSGDFGASGVNNFASHSPIAFDGSPVGFADAGLIPDAFGAPGDFGLGGFNNFGSAAPADFVPGGVSAFGSSSQVGFDGAPIGFSGFDPAADAFASSNNFAPDPVDLAAKHLGISSEQAAAISNAIGDVGSSGLSAEQAAKVAEFIGHDNLADLQNFAANAAQDFSAPSDFSPQDHFSGTQDFGAPNDFAPQDQFGSVQDFGGAGDFGSTDFNTGPFEQFSSTDFQNYEPNQSFDSFRAEPQSGDFGQRFDFGSDPGSNNNVESFDSKPPEEFFNNYFDEFSSFLQGTQNQIQQFFENNQQQFFQSEQEQQNEQEQQVGDSAVYIDAGDATVGVEITVARTEILNALGIPDLPQVIIRVDVGNSGSITEHQNGRDYLLTPNTSGDVTVTVDIDLGNGSTVDLRAVYDVAPVVVVEDAIDHGSVNEYSTITLAPNDVNSLFANVQGGIGARSLLVADSSEATATIVVDNVTGNYEITPIGSGALTLTLSGESTSTGGSVQIPLNYTVEGISSSAIAAIIGSPYDGQVLDVGEIATSESAAVTANSNNNTLELISQNILSLDVSENSEVLATLVRDADGEYQVYANDQGNLRLLASFDLGIIDPASSGTKVYKELSYDVLYGLNVGDVALESSLEIDAAFIETHFSDRLPSGARIESFFIDTNLNSPLDYQVVRNNSDDGFTLFPSSSSETGQMWFDIDVTLGGVDQPLEIPVVADVVASNQIAPIALDLDGDGSINYLNLEESQVKLDADNDGVKESVAWVGAGDGVLIYDKDDNNQVSSLDEVSFVGYQEGAQTDLEGLAAFDSDQDNLLDQDDSEWDKFKVWSDANQDGLAQEGEVSSLDEAGIVSIDLESDNNLSEYDDVTEYGRSTYTNQDGSEGVLADAAFRFEEVDNLIQSAADDSFVEGEELSASDAISSIESQDDEAMNDQYIAEQGYSQSGDENPDDLIHNDSANSGH